GAQRWFGIEADIVAYGKIVGGGLPIGIVAGKADFLDWIDGGAWSFGDRSYPRPERTLFAGTFCKHPLTMATARAVLHRLKELGPGLQESLNRRTAELAAGWNAFFAAEALPLRVNH